MPMYVERLAGAMSRAVPVPLAGAMLAVTTVAVTMVTQWLAAPLLRSARRQLAQPDGVGTSPTTKAATARMIITALMPLTPPITATMALTIITTPMLRALSITAAMRTAATSPDGRRCFRATTAGKLRSVAQFGVR